MESPAVIKRTSFVMLLAASVSAGALLMPADGRAQVIPAFPGAEGPGANATGGRGGDVYHVTNLEADPGGVIPGSLKYGINTAVAPRTIVFDVGGTMIIPGGGSQFWFRSGKSNLTIAGQTAPGGLTIAGSGSKFTGDNIIVRNLTIRPNKDPVNPTSFTYDGLSTQATNSIIDHVTVTWFTDEGISATDAVNNTTVQYSLIGEGLDYNGHSYGSILNTQNNQAPMAYHHNLYAHNSSRNPRLGSEVPNGFTVNTFDGATANFYNNVVYNWKSNAGYSALNQDSGEQEPSRTNFIGNYYIRGNNNGSTIFSSAGNRTVIHQSGNKYDGNKNGVIDGGNVTWSNFSGSETQAAAPLVVAGGVTDSADSALDRVLAHSGAFWWERNPIDARIIGSVRNGTGQIIDDPPAAEWSVVVGAPVQFRLPGWDTDNDGMPDAWEQQHGLPIDIDNHSGDFDNDGYSDLEDYLNEIAAWPAPRDVVFTGATNNRYAQITNWDIPYQPSRFDTAVIDADNVVVDAVGQHARLVKIGTGPAAAGLSITAGWLMVEDEVTIGVDDAAAAVLRLSGGMLRVPLVTKGPLGTFEFTGGVLQADVVAFDLVNQGGTLAPANRVGPLHIVGDLTLQEGGVEIEFASESDYDALLVDGTATLGGTLTVKMIDGFLPSLGQSFTILTSVARSGDFAEYVGMDVGNHLSLRPTLTSNGMVLTARPTLDGDVNLDGDVDIFDVNFVSERWGTAGPEGDANGDGAVDIFDVNLISENWGASTATGGAASVAEPGSVTLVGIASIFAASRWVYRVIGWYQGRSARCPPWHL